MDFKFGDMLKCNTSLNINVLKINMALNGDITKKEITVETCVTKFRVYFSACSCVKRGGCDSFALHSSKRKPLSFG